MSGVPQIPQMKLPPMKMAGQSNSVKSASDIHPADSEKNGEALANKAHNAKHQQPSTDDVHKKYIQALMDDGSGGDSGG